MEITALHWQLLPRRLPVHATFYSKLSERGILQMKGQRDNWHPRETLLTQYDGHVGRFCSTWNSFNSVYLQFQNYFRLAQCPILLPIIMKLSVTFLVHVRSNATGLAAEWPRRALKKYLFRCLWYTQHRWLCWFIYLFPFKIWISFLL